VQDPCQLGHDRKSLDPGLSEQDCNRVQHDRGAFGDHNGRFDSLLHAIEQSSTYYHLNWNVYAMKVECPPT